MLLVVLFILLSCFVVQAAGKMAREEGKHDPGCTLEDGFLDNLSISPSAAEPLSSRSHTHTHTHTRYIQYI